MKTLRTVLGATLGTVLLTAAVQAQVPRARIYSRPGLPSTEALRRLNLTEAWHAYVPMDGRRDAIIRVEFDGRSLYVLTKSGGIVRLDPETGEQKWRARVGKPYTLLPVFAANDRSVYVVANADVYALDRERGTQKWSYVLRGGLSAGPAVDEQQIYIPSANSRLYAFYLPFIRADAGGEASASPRSPVYGNPDPTGEARPSPVWEEETLITLVFKPLQTSDYLFLISPDGKAVGYTKVLRESTLSAEAYRFSTEGRVRVQPGQYGEIAYVGSDDSAVYAININNGKLRWRHTTGSAITRRPIALEKDIYVTSSREGLARIDRESGDALWKIPFGAALVPANVDADRFLAANERFVYASDNSGRLVILDRKRGTRLSTLDTTAFRFPVVNDTTDRLYLASNDGLIVCLHDRDQTTPIRHRSALEQASAPILKLLEEKISEPGGKPVTLREMLANLRLKHKIRFVVAERAFKAAGNAGVLETVVNLPRIENQPLKEVIRQVLTPAKATYQIVEDTILVVPAGAGK
jgi:outer membrane protein assembly factor BamB